MSVTFNKLTPNLMVEDVNRTLTFYKDVLGFEVLTTVPEEGQFQWAMMKGGGIEIMFQSRASLTEEVTLFQGKEIGGALTLYIDVKDIESLYAAIKDSVPVVQQMHSTFYGANEFAIQDCNGYVLTFAETK